MKKLTKGILTAILILLATLSLTACSFELVGGPSAYDVAVKNGFQGTEAEWLESLKGAQGPAGPQGELTVIESLYQEAVKNGFEGDFFAFIEQSLSETSISTPEYAANKAALSACSVYATFTTKQLWGSVSTATSAGAGVIWQLDQEKGDAYVITNYHVVYSATDTDGKADSIRLYLYGKEYADYAIPATYVGGAMSYDIALLKVTDSEVLKTSSVRAVDTADSDNLLLGASVVAVGNPKSDGISASSGIVSVPSEYITMTAADDQTTVEFRVIRVDAAVNSGNSGGGLYNLKGELVGIVNAKMVDSNVENIGYAIPSNIAINVAKNILANCDGGEHTMMQRCLLGVTLSQTSVTTEYDPETFAVQIKNQIVVSSVTEGGIAHGKLQVNDVVVAATLNGERKEIFAMHTAIDQLLAAKVGDTVTLEIIRNGETLTYSFTFTTATEVA